MTVVHSVSLDVSIWAFLGALVSVLRKLPADGVPTKQWLINASARLVVQTLVGIAGSASLPVIGLGVMDPRTIPSVPKWVIAFGVASSGFVFGRALGWCRAGDAQG